MQENIKEIGKTFMEYTRYKYLPRSYQSMGYEQPSLQKAAEKNNKIIDLPARDSINFKTISLMQAIENRTSIRNYSSKALSLEELSCLLWCTQGVKKTIDDYVTLRTVPSAGARHALETYLLINNVDGLETGLYRFLAIDHNLVQLSTDKNIADFIMQACLGQDFVKSSAVTFIWSAVAYRMKWRYGERGYRYIHLDAGHVCQNLYLSAEVIDCGVCAIAAFQDQEMASALNIDGEEEFVVYVATVGKK